MKDKIAACYPTEADGRVYNQFAAFTVHNSIKSLLIFVMIPHCFGLLYHMNIKAIYDMSWLFVELRKVIFIQI